MFKPHVSDNEGINQGLSSNDLLDLNDHDSSSSESSMDIHSEPNPPAMSKSPATSPSPEHHFLNVNDHPYTHVNHTINSLLTSFSTLSLILESHQETESSDASSDDANLSSYDEDGGMEIGFDDDPLVDAYHDMEYISKIGLCS